MIISREAAELWERRENEICDTAPWSRENNDEKKTVEEGKEDEEEGWAHRE